MRKILYKILAIFLIITLSSSMLVLAAEKSEETVDEMFIEAVEVLQGLNLINYSTKNPTDIVTRAEFANLLCKVLGWESLTMEDEVANTKYLGYTNDPDFDRNGDWVWDTESNDSIEEGKEYENATPFRDVLTTHEYWESIRLVARYGLMVGDLEKYFRPDEPITFIEIEKVLVYACGVSVKIGDNFPTGIMVEASKRGITKGVDVSSINGRATYRDVIVMIYNALDAKVFGMTSFSTNSVQYQETDETLLVYFRGIYTDNGIVTQNRITALDSPDGTGYDAILIDGKSYRTKGIDYDHFLGENVDYYYTDDRGEDAEIVFMINNKRGKETVVDSEDIIDYKNGKLIYQRIGERTKELYIGAGTNIIYNNKALTDYSAYTDEIITPDDGNIRFLDADSDGTYETVFINDIETVLVSGIDYTEEIIYNKFDLNNPVVLGDDFKITDISGVEYALIDVKNNNVLAVQRTLATQGEAIVNIKLASSVITGVVKSHTSSEREIEINGEIYKYSKKFDVNLIEMGPTITFYMNIDNEIVWAKRGSELTYGFITAMACDDFRDEAKIRMYDFLTSEFKIYDLAEKISVNKVRGKIEKIKTTSVLYDSLAENIKPQVIKYRLNEDGKVVELLTANIDENEFVEHSLGTSKGAMFMYRKDTGMLSTNRPVIYRNASTIYSVTPKTDFSDDEQFYSLTMPSEQEYKIDKVYKNNSKSAIASLLIKEESAGLTLEQKMQVSDPYTPVSLVKDVVHTLSEDGDRCYAITYINGDGGATYTRKVVDDDLMPIAAGLEAGDVIRCETRGQYNYIVRLVKVFDAEDRVWNGGKNPLTNNVNKLNTQITAIHGEVVSKMDDGDYIVVAPYTYIEDFEGNIIKTGIETDPTKYHIYPCTIFKFFKYEPEREIVDVANASTDILALDDTGIGSEVIVYTCYALAKSIFIFK